MEREKLVVKEYKPAQAGGTIFCEVEIKQGEMCSLIYSGQMYFGCNEDRHITTYFGWMKEQKYKRQLLKLGYKL